MRITVAPTPLKNTNSGLLVCHLSLVLWDKNIQFLKGVANYQYCGWFKVDGKSNRKYLNELKLNKISIYFSTQQNKFNIHNPSNDPLLNKYTKRGSKKTFSVKTTIEHQERRNKMLWSHSRAALLNHWRWFCTFDDTNKLCSTRRSKHLLHYHWNSPTCAKWHLPVSQSVTTHPEIYKLLTTKYQDII